MELRRLLRLGSRSHRATPATCPALGIGTALVAFFTTTVHDAAADVAVISANSQKQQIDGFGASSAWTTSQMQQPDYDLAFSADKGVGLSLLRVRIAPCQTTAPSCVLTTNEVTTAVQAQMRGAQVWASPWTPPTDWKTPPATGLGDASLLDVGTLDPAHADDWANALAAFVPWARAQGINLVAVSAQNEPDHGTATYEACGYGAPSLADFILNHMGPAFDRAGLLQGANALPFKIMGPETENWNDFGTYSGPAISGDTHGYLGILASHAYGGAPGMNPGANQQAEATTGHFWETEVYPMTATDDTMKSGLFVAQNMHDSLVAGVNAWHYWWLYPSGPNSNQGLWSAQFSMVNGMYSATYTPTKRLYAMGNFSKFVRPGFFRVAATPGPTATTSVSAYTGPAGADGNAKLVVVAINQDINDAKQTFIFDGKTTGNWSAWLTDGTNDLVQQDNAPSGGNTFDYTLRAQSVTTLVGEVTGAGPAYVAPPDAGSSEGANAGTPAAGINKGAPSSGISCSATRRLTTDDAEVGALGAGALVGILALARRRRRGVETHHRPH